MPTYAPPKKGSERELPKAKTVRGVCIGFWDLGCKDSDWKGVAKVSREVMFSFEIDQRMTGEGDYKDKRFVMSTRRFTLFLTETSNLGKFITSFLGRPLTEKEMGTYKERGTFDLESLVGMSGAVTVTHVEKDGKVYANIQNITPLMDGVEPIVQETKWDKAPDWIQKIIEDGWTVKDSDSAMCKMAKCELLVAKEEAEEKAKKSTVATSATTSEAEAIGADSTAELIAECDAEQAIAQAETEIPFGSPAEDVSSLSEPEMILKIRKLCMELKIEVQKHITATLGNPITTDKLTKEQAEQVLLELIKIKQSQESFAEESEGE